MSPSGPVELRAIGLIRLSTERDMGGLPGKDHCDVWTNDRGTGDAD